VFGHRLQSALNPPSIKASNVRVFEEVQIHAE
jgi:hypothetical protein